MHIQVLVEEPSAESAIRCLLPKLLPDTATFDVHVYQGKPDLLGKLPSRLRAYSSWLPKDWRIVVLVDRDQDDCRELKTRLERIAQEAGLSTKSSPATGGEFQVVNRLAIEELEAWFFGDVQALRAAYPRVPATLTRRRSFRDPDAVAGGTWEALERVLKNAGYYSARMPKLEVARRVSGHMIPEQNESRSFSVFWEGVKACLS